MRLELLVTCEHGGNAVPAEYRALFEGVEDVLRTHRAFDAGALGVARALCAACASSDGERARLIASETTRLLADLNRSPNHPRLFSEFSRALVPAEKARLLARHYFPFREEVEQAVEAAARRGVFLLHVSSHSFTPSLDGVERRADIGLLFDPARAAEARIASVWRDALRAALPGWTIRRNYPYRGTSDGLTTHLRKRFGDTEYAGIELEVNQKHVACARWPQHTAAVVESLVAALASAAAAIAPPPPNR